MKAGSDNHRFSAVQGIIKRIQARGIKVVIFDTSLDLSKFSGADVLKDIDSFKVMSDVIVANRVSKDLDDVSDKCFSRDLFGDN